MLPAFCRLESIILHTNFRINTNGEAPESCIIFSYSTQEMFSGIFYEPALSGVLTIKRNRRGWLPSLRPEFDLQDPHGGKREQTPASCPLSQHTCVQASTLSQHKIK